MSQPLIHFGVAAPNRPAVDTMNNDVQWEHQFNRTSLANSVANNEQLLTAEQLNIYDQINVSISTQQGGFFFWAHLVVLAKHSSYCSYLREFDRKIILLWLLLQQESQQRNLMVDC